MKTCNVIITFLYNCLSPEPYKAIEYYHDLKTIG